MYREYKDRAEFLFVYIHEAHPDDGWQMPANERDKVIFNQPTTWDERQSVAKKCCSSLTLSLPCVVDDMKNSVDQAYAGWPERLFIIEKDGRVAYAGAQGPMGFHPEQVEAWLKKNLPPANSASAPASQPSSQPSGQP